MTTATKHQRLHLPRILLLWWSIWLLISWILAYSRNWSIIPSELTHIASTRRMLVAISLGLTIVWPMFRLTFTPSRSRCRLAVFIDWLALIGTLQIVLWPMRLSTSWSTARVALLVTIIGAWTLITGAFIALGLLSSQKWGRTASMLLCLLLVCAAPIASLFFNTTLGSTQRNLLDWSPVTQLWNLAERTCQLVSRTEWTQAGLLLVISVLLWIAVALWPITDQPPLITKTKNATPPTT